MNKINQYNEIISDDDNKITNLNRTIENITEEYNQLKIKYNNDITLTNVFYYLIIQKNIKDLKDNLQVL